MSRWIFALLPLLVVLAIFFVIYRSVRGKRSSKLKGWGWLELLIAYLWFVVPIGLNMGSGEMRPVFKMLPGLSSLHMLDSLMRLVLLLMSFYGGVCLWKTARGAVKKAKIILTALLIFNVLVFKVIYSLVIYAAMARANMSIPAGAVFDAFMKDIAGSIFNVAVVVSWYVYLNRSQRVREIYSTSSAIQTITYETKTTEN